MMPARSLPCIKLEGGLEQMGQSNPSASYALLSQLWTSSASLLLHPKAKMYPQTERKGWVPACNFTELVHYLHKVASSLPLSDAPPHLT